MPPGFEIKLAADWLISALMDRLTGFLLADISLDGWALWVPIGWMENHLALDWLIAALMDWLTGYLLVERETIWLLIGWSQNRWIGWLASDWLEGKPSDNWLAYYNSGLSNPTWTKQEVAGSHVMVSYIASHQSYSIVEYARLHLHIWF